MRHHCRSCSVLKVQSTMKRWEVIAKTGALDKCAVSFVPCLLIASPALRGARRLFVRASGS